MWRLSYRILRGISGLWFWVHRRLTGAGLLVLSALIVAGALAADTKQSLAYQVFAFLAALLAVSFVASYFVRPRFQAERALPRRVTAGQAFEYRVTVRHLGARAADGVVVLEDLADPRPDLAEFRSRLRFPSYRGWWRIQMQKEVAKVDEAPLQLLAPGVVADVRIRARALRRGTQHFVGLTLARADPLGLVRSFARVRRPDKLLVLPRRYALPPLSLPGARTYQHGGVTLAASVGDSEEFMSLRAYRPGDPLQRIHWKSCARAGEPVVKEFQEEFFERHALVLDTFGNGEDAVFEEAVSVAASFACTIDTQECLLDLLFIGAESHCYTAGRGHLQATSLAEVLAGVRVCTKRSFDSLAHAILSRRATLSGCILILLGWDDARRKLVEDLRRTGLALKVLVVSERASEPPPPGVLVLLAGKIQEGLARL